MHFRTLTLLLCLAANSAYADPQLTPAERTAIDAAVQQTLAATGVPAASVAIVRDDKIIATAAYGFARLDPPTQATPDMAFAIGSISKQFTVAAILFLVQDGKLSLDDPVAKYLPELTQANDVTIRQLLSHTAGYQDFWPEDYSPLAFRNPTTPKDIVDTWAKKPLDFPPGTAWQYSNTGFCIAALIAEQAGHEPFFFQLQRRILTPLGMKSAADYNAFGIPQGGPTGYERYAFSPPRPAPLDRPGWSFGSGGLAMTAHDLALWDISLIDRTLLKPASYDAMETETRLKNGQGTGYGLGVTIGHRGGHRIIEHSGEETGFVAENIVFPDDHDAVVVLTNQDASRAARNIAYQIAGIAFAIPPADPADRHAALILAMLADLAHGRVDPARLNDNANSYFSPAVLADYRASLGPLGAPLNLRERAHEDRGGMVFRAWEAIYPARTVTITTYERPDGRLGQFLIEP
jgi:CubicO group peptidase (beta-lactamase class C family)